MNGNVSSVIRAWIALMCVMTLEINGATPSLRIGVSGNTIGLSWDSEIGTTYQLQSKGLTGIWTNIQSPVAGTGLVIEKTVTRGQPLEFFRLLLVGPEIAGSLGLTNSQVLSGLESIDVFTHSSGENRLQWIILIDGTNVLDKIDAVATPLRAFTLDTYRIPNGQRQLWIQLVFSKTDDATGKAYTYDSEKVAVTINNPLSVLSDIETQWKWYIRFKPNVPNVTSWSASIANALGQTLTNVVNRPLTGWTNSLGEIVFEDTTTFANSYVGDTLDIELTLRTSTGSTYTYAYRSPIIHGWSEFEYEGLVVQQANAPFPFILDQMDNLNEVAQEVLFNTADIIDHFNFVTQVRDGLDTQNVVDLSTDWDIFGRYVSGDYARGPSHLYFWGNLFATDGSTNDITRILAQANSGTNRLSFTFIDGCSIPQYLIQALTDINRNRSREDLYREGKRPQTLVFWQMEKDFSYLQGEADLPAEESILRVDLYEQLWFGPGWPTTPIYDAVNTIKTTYPDLSTNLSVFGSSRGVFVDETSLTF